MQQRITFLLAGRRVFIMIGIGIKNNSKSDEILHAVANIMW